VCARHAIYQKRSPQRVRKTPSLRWPAACHPTRSTPDHPLGERAQPRLVAFEATPRTPTGCFCASPPLQRV
jgi:hypothetical protein